MRTTNLKEFLFGAPYYPEHWTPQDMENDPERMVAARFNVVRIGEFAWDLMEPREGAYDFTYFDYHIAQLGERGVGTILCTPTATPPRWLTYEHPDILRVDHMGRSMAHGSRQHACHSSRKFRSYGRAVVSAMANHFRGNPNVIGWQTDNEFFCHFSECYCANCETAFRVWLKAKYESIEELNRAWGTAFWALTFGSFDEVGLPVPDRPTYVNPSQALDYHLFLSDELIEFQREQVQILREANPAWFVMHNGHFGNIDYRKFCQDLDFFGVDIYPLFTRTAERAEHVAFSLDTTRSYAGNFIIPEQQSGPGGQGNYFHDQPQPGQIRLWSYQAIARGADGVLHFRWRTCRFGAEQYWVGILDHDNIPRRRYDEICREGREFAELSKHLLGTHLSPDVGILFDSGLVTMGHKPITLGLPEPYETAREVHKAFYRASYSVGLVNPADNLSTFKIIFLPSWAIVTPELAAKLEAYVEAGGLLVVSARSGVKNERSHVISETVPGLLRRVTGIEIDEYRHVVEPDTSPNSVIWEGRTISQHLWIEQLVPKTARVLGRWTDGIEKGTAAMAVNELGEGKCLYIGTFLSSQGTEALIPYLSAVAGVSPLVPNCPQGVEVTVRECGAYKLFFYLNHSRDEMRLTISSEGVDILTGQAMSGELCLEPYGVAVIRVDRRPSA